MSRYEKEEIIIPVLYVIEQMGGEGKRQEIRNEVAKKFPEFSDLKLTDLDSLRGKLVAKGYLKNLKGKEGWHIDEKGKLLLKGAEKVYQQKYQEEIDKWRKQRNRWFEAARKLLGKWRKSEVDVEELFEWFEEETENKPIIE